LLLAYLSAQPFLAVHYGKEMNGDLHVQGIAKGNLHAPSINRGKKLHALSVF
jgi:hypothetical protein